MSTLEELFWTTGLPVLAILGKLGFRQRSFSETGLLAYRFLGNTEDKKEPKLVSSSG